MREFGRTHGIVASDRLIDSEIAKIPAFQGPDGKFSEAAFRQALAAGGMTEQLVRDDLAQGLIARQVLDPAAFGARVPRELALRYAALLTRDSAPARSPCSRRPPSRRQTPPSDAELQAYLRQDNATGSSGPNAA